MSNDTHDPHAPANGAGASASDPSASAAEDTHASEYGPKGVTPNPNAEPTPVQALEAQVADLKDQVLRAFAEMENIRKRGERERLDTQKYAVSKFARDILPVADNLERAIAAAPADSADPILKGLLDGVTVTERSLTGILERHGISRIVTDGATFDPHKHQAVMEHPDPSVPSGTIVRVFEAGYMIGDRVLRPASVVVAKGAPKTAKPASSQDAEATAASTPEAGSTADNDNGAGGGSSGPSAGA